ncbi:MAG: ABC transporter ATP-binding protein [Pseudomonadota bacterium]
MSEPVLSVRDLVVEIPTRHGVVRPVNHVSYDVAPGEIMGVVGESGAGKSMTGNAIIGLLDRPARIASGEIYLQGERIDGLSLEGMRPYRGKRIGMVFQDPLTSLNPLFTIREQLVETILTHLDISKAEANRRAFEIIDRVRIPDPETRLDHYPHQFSGGMRQRVVIALALCTEPDVIIADEPTTALDVAIQAEILDLLKELVRERQVGAILITHDMGVIADTTDRLTVMYMGQVVESGPTEQVMGRPEHDYTKSLIAAVPRPGKKLHRFPLLSYGGRETRFEIEALSRNWPRVESDISRPLLKVEGLTKRFLQKRGLLPWDREYFTAVDTVSFDIKPGEVFGVVGESGSGKSTVARMISGLYQVDAGRIFFDGQEVSDLSDRAAQSAYKRQIQMVFQDPYSSLNPRMRVDEIVAEPIRHHKLLQGDAIKFRVDELLDHLGLGASAGRKFPHEFSGGQRQRISIARALATQPRFLICDEPTSALDVSVQAQILNILKDLQEYLGLTMLFISHDLPVVRQICDRVAVMNVGKIVELQSTEDLFAAPETEYARALLDLMPRLDGISEEGLAAETT